MAREGTFVGLQKWKVVPQWRTSSMICFIHFILHIGWSGCPTPCTRLLSTGWSKANIKPLNQVKRIPLQLLWNNILQPFYIAQALQKNVCSYKLHKSWCSVKCSRQQCQCLCCAIENTPCILDILYELIKWLIWNLKRLILKVLWRNYEFITGEEENSILQQCQLLKQFLLSFLPFPTGQYSCKRLLASVKQWRIKYLSLKRH